MSPALLPDKDEPYVLQDVWERMKYGSRAELVLQWDGGYLLFCADIDTDSMEVEFHEGDLAPSRKYRSLRSVSPWAEYIGEKGGWTWLAVNQQGYCDTALISFGNIIPNIMLHVICSAIKVFTIAPE
jgi:hypothetical protein